jgi:transposase
MARKAKGDGVLGLAKGLLAKTKDHNALRTLQAVVLPLERGMSIRETAEAIGRSVRWTTGARNAFIRSGGLPGKKPAAPRNRAHMAEADEAAFLAPFLDAARRGGVLVVGGIHAALEARLGRRVSLTSVYALLHRHDWRKLAPDRRHARADPEAQEKWKKNCGRGSGGSKKGGGGGAKSG